MHMNDLDDSSSSEDISISSDDISEVEIDEEDDSVSQSKKSCTLQDLSVCQSEQHSHSHSHSHSYSHNSLSSLNSEYNDKLDSYDLSAFEVPVYIKKGNYGLGIYFNSTLKAGTRVVCLCCTDCCKAENHIKIAEIKSWNEQQRSAIQHAIQVNTSEICLEWQEIISGHANLGINYINHSCDPTTWFQSNTDAFILETRKTVYSGDEVTFDYGTCEYDRSGIEDLLLNLHCSCNTTNCRKRIICTDYLLPEIQKRYNNHFSPFITKHLQSYQE